MTQVDGQHVSVFPSEIDIRVKASAPIIHAVGGSDSSGCTPGNNPTYLQLFFFFFFFSLCLTGCFMTVAMGYSQSEGFLLGCPHVLY